MVDKTRTLVVALLVLAILFSAASIFISYAALKVDLPNKALPSVGRVVDNGGGNLLLVVEGNNPEANP